MGKRYVAIRSNATGTILYDNEDWFFFNNHLKESLPCKSIEYIDLSNLGMESFYKVIFKINEYTYEEHLPSSSYTGIMLIHKEEA